MRRIAVTVNGVRHEAEVEPRELLVYFLREQLGLTGTNVGCDTSSCGACTVLLDGESVKSCTVLAVQADGAEVTTIEGLATNGELHPCSRPSTSTTRCSAATARPGWCMATVSLLAENPNPSEERDPRRRSRATSAAAPATTTSSRPSRPRRRRRGARWRPPRAALRRPAGPAQGGPGAPHRAGAVRRRHDAAGHGLDARRPQPATRTRASAASTSRPRERPRAWSPRSPAPTSQDELAGGASVAWPVTEDIKNPPHWPLDQGQGPLRRRRRRGRGRGDARAGEGRRRARRGRLRAAAGRHRRRGGARGRRADRPRGRSARTSPCTWTLPARRGRPRSFFEAAVTVKERYRQQRLSRTRSSRAACSSSRRPRRASTRSSRRPRSPTSCATTLALGPASRRRSCA